MPCDTSRFLPVTEKFGTNTLNSMINSTIGEADGFYFKNYEHGLKDCLLPLFQGVLTLALKTAAVAQTSCIVHLRVFQFFNSAANMLSHFNLNAL